jgi:hypothetical protein
MTHITMPMFYRNALTAKSAKAELTPTSFYRLLDRLADRATVNLGSLNSTPKPGDSSRTI